MNGGLPVSSFIGIVVGHVYYFLDRVMPVEEGAKRCTDTPAWFAGLFSEQEWIAPGSAESGGGRTGGAKASASGWKTGGQRLGTED